MAFLFGDLAYLYGENRFDYMSKNGYDYDKKFIEASNDRSGYDYRHGIVRKFNPANSKTFLLAPIGDLAFYRSGGLPQALEAVDWTLVDQVILGKQNGQWYFIVKMHRIATPSMANKASIKLNNYMSLALDSRMAWYETAKQQLFPFIVVRNFTYVPSVIMNFGAQLRTHGYGRPKLTLAQKYIVEQWSEFSEQELITSLQLVESKQEIQREVEAATAAFMLDEEDEEMRNVEYTPYTPRAMRAPKRKYQQVHLAEYNATWEPAVKQNKPMKLEPKVRSFNHMGPTHTDFGQRTWKSLKTSMDNRKNKRLQVVNFKRGMDPMDSIFR